MSKMPSVWNPPKVSHSSRNKVQTPCMACEALHRQARTHLPPGGPSKLSFRPWNTPHVPTPRTLVLAGPSPLRSPSGQGHPGRPGHLPGARRIKQPSAAHRGHMGLFHSAQATLVRFTASFSPHRTAARSSTLTPPAKSRSAKNTRKRHELTARLPSLKGGNLEAPPPGSLLGSALGRALLGGAGASPPAPPGTSGRLGSAAPAAVPRPRRHGWAGTYAVSSVAPWTAVAGSARRR